jgi:hypothetical protein
VKEQQPSDHDLELALKASTDLAKEEEKRLKKAL